MIFLNFYSNAILWESFELKAQVLEMGSCFRIFDQAVININRKSTDSEGTDDSCLKIVVSSHWNLAVNFNQVDL